MEGSGRDIGPLLQQALATVEPTGQGAVAAEPRSQARAARRVLRRPMPWAGPSRPERFSILRTNRRLPTKEVVARKLPGGATSAPSARPPARARQYTAQTEGRIATSAGHEGACASVSGVTGTARCGCSTFGSSAGGCGFRGGRGGGWGFGVGRWTFDVRRSGLRLAVAGSRSRVPGGTSSAAPHDL